MSPKIVNVETMQAIEKAADKAGHSYRDMMELAGRAVADYILDIVVNYMLEPHILILVGPGNNGGDGLVAGRFLVEDLPDATVVAHLMKAHDDEVFETAREAGVSIIDTKALEAALLDTSIVVDALFGTGARLPIEGSAAEILDKVHKVLQNRQDFTVSLNPLTAPPQTIIDRPIIIAVDCPSGLDCDTGELDKRSLQADATITFAAAKPGQFIFPGANSVGDLVIGDIGLPDELEELNTVKLEVADGAMIKALIPPRNPNAHKGTFGKAMIVAGSANYIGAAYLAGAAAYRVGAGLVTVGAPQIIVSTLAGLLPEATWVLLPHEMGVLHERAVPIIREASEGYNAFLLGPGLSQDDVTQKLIEELFRADKPTPTTPRKHIGFQFPDTEEKDADADKPSVNLPPLVIDADGLNLLAKIENWWELLPPNTILTPHPAEFARLTGEQSTAEQIQADRINMAIKYAAEWKAIVVLKGAYTVVASPAGDATVVPFATSALSTAGTGDVLAGAITGLLAQGLEPVKAAIGGAWLHGLAGTLAANELQTATSVVASDVLFQLSAAISSIE